MLLPGKIENWVVITDMDNTNLGPSGISKLKQTLKVLTDNYRCRLGVNYVLNPSKSVYFVWSCLKPFMDEVLMDKIKIINSNHSPELLALCNPNQIEQKFGGKAPNRTSFWPPYVPPGPYQFENIGKSNNLLEKHSEIQVESPEKPQILIEQPLKNNKNETSNLLESKLSDDFKDIPELDDKNLQFNLNTQVVEYQLEDNPINYEEIKENFDEIQIKQEKELRKQIRKERRAKRKADELQNNIIEKDDFENNQEPDIDHNKEVSIEKTLIESKKVESNCLLCSSFSSNLSPCGIF